MKKTELLAPVGNYDSLVAAIEAGCDAVYLAGKLYGARSFAENFSNEKLIDALNYAHLYGVKVYVTVNTLVYDSEVDNFIDYIEFLYTNGVDAIIIQDIGMFDLVRKLYPNLEIHISTQMHIHNLEGTKMMEELGASRVVLARETPIELVQEIKKKTNIQLEIFVHGALCISYSGQCLMSSLIGGRSGNRGTCAQCCRQPYDLYMNDKKISDEKYLLSTRDLNSLENIGNLIDMGIDSFKIEGRMKRPEYVYLIVSIYRKAIDNYIKFKNTKITKNDIKEIKKIFNRKFTKGFLFNTKNNDLINSYRPNHQGIEVGKVIFTTKNYISIRLTDDLNVQDGIRFVGDNDIGLTIQTMYKNKSRVTEAHKNDIVSIYHDKVPNINDIVVKTTDTNQIKKINQFIKNKNRKVLIDIKIFANVNSNLSIIITDGNNIVKEISDYVVQQSMNRPTTKDDIIKQFSKIGDTIFKINNVELNIDDNIFIPVKIINTIRRKVLDKLIEQRLIKKEIVHGNYSIDIPDYEFLRKKSILIDKKSMYTEKLNDEYDEIIIDTNEKLDDSFRIKLPRVQEVLKNVNGKLLVGELGSVYKYCNKINDVTTDFSLNVTNSYSVAFLHSLGVNRITLSLEMNDYQIDKLISNYHERYKKHPNLELVISDIPEAMILKYDIFDGNYIKKNKYYLKDKYGNKFRIIRKNNLTYIYNYKHIIKENPNRYYDMGINYLRENSIFL